MGKTKMYLAYGSNLNLGQMKYRCPNSETVGTAILKDHRLAYRGMPGNAHATIEPAQGRNVPVLIWEVPVEDEKRLDRYEGYPKYYFKQDIEAVMDEDGRTVSAMVYIMDKRRIPNYPSPSYIKTIEEGYEDCGFDISYLQTSLMENVDEVAIPLKTESSSTK